MKTVSMHEAKTHLSRLVDLALTGEEVVIVRRKEPVIRLTPLEEKPKKRRIGVAPSLVARMGDGFDDSFEDWDDPLVPNEGPGRTGAER